MSQLKLCSLGLLLLFLPQTVEAQQLSVLTNLHPRPQSSFLLPSGGGFPITSLTPIVLSDTPSNGAFKAAGYLVAHLAPYGVIPDIVHSKDYTGAVPAIFIGEIGSFMRLTDSVRVAQPAGEGMPGSEGYVLHVASGAILLAGVDTSGTFYAATTLVQLLNGPSTHVNIPALHIWDQPDYPERWIFSQQNLQVAKTAEFVSALEDSMGALKLNGYMDGDFKNNILESVPSWYFSDVDTVKASAARNNVSVIPGVCDIGYSQGILMHDPNLAEGFPTTSLVQLTGGAAAVVTDPRMILPNGSFESIANGTFTGWSFYDGAKQSAFVDSTEFHGGRYSARCENFTAGNAAGNCRFERTLYSKPFHSYHMSVWIKTAGLNADEFQLLAIGQHAGNRTLTASQYSVPATSNGWMRYDIVFNSLNYDTILAYAGVWGGHTGKIWLDDFSIEDAGFTNVLRRPTTMPVVENARTHVRYIEGADYLPIVDSVMEQSYGTYAWHTSPEFRLTPSSSIPLNDSLLVHFYRPLTTITGQDGDGQTMVCISEDSTYGILRDQISRVNGLWHPKKFFMGHDEIRVLNWDTACTSRYETPARLLADNLAKCDSLIHLVHHGTQTYIWSDMFDSLHNAHNNYYLVNGDLTGDWNMIPKDVTIVNWNGNHLPSLRFFSGHGFKQITAPYYDTHNTQNIRDWRIAMEGVPNVRGMMYTTWSGDYSEIGPFADYAWSAGPMIVHTPIDSATAWNNGNPYMVMASAFPDPYLASDQITTVTLEMQMTPDSVVGVAFVPSHTDYMAMADMTKALSYRVVARNSEGITRSTPWYLLRTTAPLAAVIHENASAALTLRAYPTPGRGRVSIDFGTALSRASALTVSSIDGIVVRTVEIPAGARRCTFDLSDQPSGTYTASLKSENLLGSVNVVIDR